MDTIRNKYESGIKKIVFYFEDSPISITGCSVEERNKCFYLMSKEHTIITFVDSFNYKLDNIYRDEWGAYYSFSKKDVFGKKKKKR